MEYVECPDDEATSLWPKLFLAGGITGCPDWQAEVVTALRDVGVCVVNPRRKHFDVNDKAATPQQIKWEYEKMRDSQFLLFWFPAESLCPIALYELGRFNALRPDSRVLIGTHPQYSRREDVVHQTALATGKTVYSDLSAMISDLRAMLTG
jgi:Nucleoside 2-deoxyribosyltransferase like